MTRFRNLRKLLVALSIGSMATIAVAEPQHGIAMYGSPALPRDFVSLPYANPDAPFGGKIVSGEVGSFDSLNPHVLKGRVPWQLRFLAYESLMGRSWDEPFSLYGLLAETIETDETNRWVEFKLRDEAKFSDGSPVTVEDVIWSYETLGDPTIGNPRYHGAWAKIEKVEKTAPNTVKFTFKAQDRELALIMGLGPILQKAQWDGKDFTGSGLDDIPISSAPYVISDFDAGRYVTLTRNPDYWGQNIGFRRGTNVIDEVRFEFFGDATAHFEAFKVGEISTLRESNTAKWAQQYDFPRVASGDVIKAEIPHQRPSGMTGFVMNTRREIFKDWRVRDAMIQAFNFEFINETLNGGTEPRITSYFANSPLAMTSDPAEGRVAELLQPFADDLLPGTLEGYALPESDGSGRNRAGLRRATDMLEDAGFTQEDGKLIMPNGEPVVIEILLQTGSSENQAITNIYVEALKRLGIDVTINAIDSAQYRERVDSFDFDMTYFTRGLSLSPGNEQLTYWGSKAAETPGSRNLMGMNSAPAEAMIDRMLNSPDQADYVAAVKALDRILTAGRYVVPFWYSDVSRLAHGKSFKYPDRLPLYGDFIGFQPDVWWVEN